MFNYPEGATPIDKNEIEGLKFKHITKKSELDHLEQANITSGIQWMLKRKGSDILNEQYLKELHKKLFGDVWEWAGKFRTTGKNIGVDPYVISIELRKLLGDVEYWLTNKTFEPYEAAIRFHHKLVYIHPFPNGNGRHSRIMTDALLIKKCGLVAIDWSSGQDLDVTGDYRRKYICALREADKGNYDLLIEFTKIRKREGKNE